LICDIIWSNNVEIQVSDRDSHPRRVRYYQSAIDWSILEKGAKYEELPDVYLIFISAFDIIGLGKTKYQVKRVVDGTDVTLDNGIHEVYFNTKAKDDTLLSQLLEYFNNSDADNPKFGALSEKVHFQKRTKKGVNRMCQSVHAYGDEREEFGRAEGRAEGKLQGKIDTVKNMLNDGITLEKALELTALDKDTYEKNKDNIE
jgi:predicted transposase/invertase (TIGR01784 family)